MKTYTQLFEVENHFYPSAERSAILRNGESHSPPSYVFLCPCCGNSWARFPVKNNYTGAISRFTAIEYLCRKCSNNGRYLHIPGTLYVPWDADFSNSLPPELLRRELGILLQQYPE